MKQKINPKVECVQSINVQCQICKHSMRKHGNYVETEKVLGYLLPSQRNMECKECEGGICLGKK